MPQRKYADQPAPASLSSRVISVLHFAVVFNAVHPFLFLMRASAPWASRVLTTSARPLEAASISAVQPSRSCAFTSAPRFNKLGDGIDMTPKDCLYQWCASAGVGRVNGDAVVQEGAYGAGIPNQCRSQ